MIKADVILPLVLPETLQNPKRKNLIQACLNASDAPSQKIAATQTFEKFK